MLPTVRACGDGGGCGGGRECKREIKSILEGVNRTGRKSPTRLGHRVFVP